MPVQLVHVDEDVEKEDGEELVEAGAVLVGEGLRQGLVPIIIIMSERGHWLCWFVSMHSA